MKELYWLLRIEATSLTAYHPQTDGQTEQVNQELEQYICIFVREQQDDWYNFLLLVEFFYNNHVHSSTQQTHSYSTLADTLGWALNGINLGPELKR